ncbi:uncharacterized protein [Rhodnius prolixus]|uniref:uncharacterized protein n=1 Tax=Rhodnius prolixus TaxID=13249 RepID=UPI003D187E63
MNFNMHAVSGIDILRMELNANGELYVLAPPSLDHDAVRSMVNLVYEGEFFYIKVEHHQLQPTWIHSEFQVNRSINHFRSGGFVVGPLLELTIIGSQLILLQSYRNLDNMFVSWILEKTLFPGEVVFQFCPSMAYDVWFHIHAWELMISRVSYFERSRAMRAGGVFYGYERTTISCNDIAAFNMRGGVRIEMTLIHRSVWQVSNGRSIM